MDWVSATLRGVDPDVLAQQLSNVHTWIRTRGLNGYSESLIGVGSVRICFTPGRDDVHLIAPGQWLQLVSVDGQRELLQELHRLKAAFTRVDLQLTDERPVTTPRDVWGALRRGEAVTRVKSWDWMERGGSNRGSSVYIGSKASLQRLVVYDKGAESKGEVRGVRWELRMRDEAAETLVPQLLESSDWGAVWAGRTLAFVDFRGVTDATNSARRPRVAWFEELVQGAEKMRAYPARPLRSLDDLRRWLRHQVAPALATIVLAAGGDIDPLVDLAREGLPRIRETHRAMLDAEREQEE